MIHTLYNPRKGESTYAVGHLAVGYLCGKVTTKVLNAKLNLPLIFLVSIISDIDLLIPSLIHRGPTHSITLSLLIFLPVFVIHGKEALQYFVGLIQHPLIGDYLTGDTQLLWPLTTKWYGAGVGMTSQTNILLEWGLFLTFLTLMIKTKDAHTLLQPHPTNLILAIPVFTVLLPTLFSFPLHVPSELIIPHLTCLTLFILSILIDLR